jgi:hypothetical protein
MTGTPVNREMAGFSMYRLAAAALRDGLTARVAFAPSD